MEPSFWPRRTVSGPHPQAQGYRHDRQSSCAQSCWHTRSDRSARRYASLSAPVLARPQSHRDAVQQAEGVSAQGGGTNDSSPAPPMFYELRPELHAGRLPGADLFGADQGIGVVGGQPSAAVVPVGENQVSRPDTVEMARESIRQMAARKTDMVKIWLDSAGGLMPKLKPEVYSAVIDEAHKNGLRVAAHIYDLDDAKAVVRAGVDVIAHGVRDKPVDSEFIDMMK